MECCSVSSTMIPQQIRHAVEHNNHRIVSLVCDKLKHGHLNAKTENHRKTQKVIKADCNIVAVRVNRGGKPGQLYRTKIPDNGKVSGNFYTSYWYRGEIPCQWCYA